MWTPQVPDPENSRQCSDDKSEAMWSFTNNRADITIPRPVNRRC